MFEILKTYTNASEPKWVKSILDIIWVTHLCSEASIYINKWILLNLVSRIRFIFPYVVISVCLFFIKYNLNQLIASEAYNLIRKCL